MRDAESRTRFLGYRVEHFKYLHLRRLGDDGEIAGALYVPQVGIINPGEFAPTNSVGVVIWTAVGGRSTLIQTDRDAIVVNGGKTIFTGLFPEFWLFALGGLFVAVTLFLPKGIVGTIGQYVGKRGPSSSDTPPARREDGVDAEIQPTRSEAP